MYTPPLHAVTDLSEIRAIVASAGSAQLVTVGPDGFPMATLLPIMWTGDTVVAHMARANDQWQAIGAGAPGLLIVTGPEAYISPSWYPSKVATGGRVVPTWNYSAVHLRGQVVVHDDAAWVRAAVDALVDTHEGGRADPWRTSDAPPGYIGAQLRAIVGIEMRVERVDGKAKWSQNRSIDDRRGVIAGLRAEGERDGARVIAAAMAAQLTPAR